MIFKDRKPTSGTAPGLSSRPGAMPASHRGAAEVDRRQHGWELGLPAYAEIGGASPPLILAIGGGKGGVGKSLVSANLSVRLAAAGLRVLAIDLDVGGANLHTYFGVGAPTFGLADVIVSQKRSLDDVILGTGIVGVQLIAGGNEEIWGGPMRMDEPVLGRLFTALTEIKTKRLADLVILDLGAGTHQHTLDFFAAAHLGLITVLPEPTSIENAYLFLKTTLFRLIENVGARLGMSDVATHVRDLLLTQESIGGKPRTVGYAEKLRQAAVVHPGFVTQLSQALQARTLGVAVNQVRGQKDIDIGKSMELIGERYFGFNTRYCGYLNYDEAAWKSLRNRRLLVVDFPHSALSKRFTELSKAVLTNLGL